MALTLIVETGAGVAGANTYADLDAAEAHFEAHLYADAWTATDADRQAVALAHAARTLDAAAASSLRGDPVSATQARAFPRSGLEPLIDDATVPPAWIVAQLELALALIKADREAKADGPAVKRQKADVLEREFVSGDRLPLLPPHVAALIAPFLKASAAAGATGAASSSVVSVARA